MSFLKKIGDILGGDVIGTLADTADRFIHTKEEKAAFQKEMLELQHKIDMADKELELKDIMSARDREARVKATGSKDIMMTITGLAALVAGLSVIIIGFMMEEMTQMQERIFYFIAGASFGWFTNVVSYYYGSSKGSKDKQSEFQDLIKNGK